MKLLWPKCTPQRLVLKHPHCCMSCSGRTLKSTAIWIVTLLQTLVTLLFPLPQFPPGLCQAGHSTRRDASLFVISCCIFDPEDGGDIFLPNIGGHLRNYMGLKARRSYCSLSVYVLS
jgi:hypothetical protein